MLAAERRIDPLRNRKRRAPPDAPHCQGFWMSELDDAFGCAAAGTGLAAGTTGLRVAATPGLPFSRSSTTVSLGSDPSSTNDCAEYPVLRAVTVNVSPAGTSTTT